MPRPALLAHLVLPAVLLVGGCSHAGAPDGTTAAGDRADPRASGREAVGGTRAPAPAGSTAGPHEGERASTPPGRSRDELPPAGGTLRDPAGAVTRETPPPGLR